MPVVTDLVMMLAVNFSFGALFRAPTTLAASVLAVLKLALPGLR
jgi:hypothetical protein